MPYHDDKLPSALRALVQPGQHLVAMMIHPERAPVRCPRMREGRGGELRLEVCAKRYRDGADDRLCDCDGCLDGPARSWDYACITGQIE